MAVYLTEEAPEIVYENHPEGTGFTGVITEVSIAKQPTADYPNKDGTTTRAHKRAVVITNTSGHTKTYTDSNGMEQTVPHQVRQTFQFYENPNGSIRKPQSGGIFDLWKQIYGVSPKFEPFDDEECVGRVVMYGVEYNEGEGQHLGKTFANISTMMPAPDQTIPEGTKLWTQEERAGISGGQTGQAPAQTSQPPVEGSAGAREGLKEACRKWIVYLTINDVYTEKQATNFENFANMENDPVKLKEFCAKAESDCKGAFLTLPTPHPESSGGDDLPI